VKHDAKSPFKLTVAHVIASSIIGGVEIATLRLTAATNSQFRHVVFCVRDAVALRDLFEKQGIETISYTPPTPSLRHGIRFYKESRAIARQLKSVGADIVHFADNSAAYYASFAALLARTRNICHVRSRCPHLALRGRLSLLPVHNYIFVSKEAKNTFALSVPDSKARVIYDAIEVSTADMTESNAAVRRELGIAPECALVGSVARVAPQKDFHTMISAAAEVISKYPTVRFLVVGEHSSDGPHRLLYEEIRHRIKELGISHSFIFTGYRDDVSRLIAAMDISVLCTHREGFPLSILESMALRRPVIATAVGGIPEIIKHDVTGYLHQHGNSKELARAIISLIDNPEEAKRIGLAGYELVRNNYSPHKYIMEIAKAYSDAMR
jgi:glycosyltransferase involved in cell wall biosynthesis